MLITSASIGVTDPDSSSFAFTVSNVTHGAFQTTTDGVTWTNATTFTTTDLAASHVRFVHDGSVTAPTFSIQANDGAALNNLSNLFVGSVLFNNVNHAPVATPVTLAAGTEDTAYIITAASLLAGVTDVDGQALSITAVERGERRRQHRQQRQRHLDLYAGGQRPTARSASATPPPTVR